MSIRYFLNAEVNLKSKGQIVKGWRARLTASNKYDSTHPPKDKPEHHSPPHPHIGSLALAIPKMSLTSAVIRGMCQVSVVP